MRQTGKPMSPCPCRRKLECPTDASMELKNVEEIKVGITDEVCRTVLSSQFILIFHYHNPLLGSSKQKSNPPQTSRFREFKVVPD